MFFHFLLVIHCVNLNNNTIKNRDLVKQGVHSKVSYSQSSASQSVCELQYLRILQRRGV